MIDGIKEKVVVFFKFGLGFECEYGNSRIKLYVMILMIFSFFVVYCEFEGIIGEEGNYWLLVFFGVFFLIFGDEGVGIKVWKLYMIMK